MSTPSEPDYEGMARVVAWPHCDMIEPRAGDTLVENIAEALRSIARAEYARGLEEVIRIIQSHDDTCNTAECHTLSIEEAIRARLGNGVEG